MRSYERLLSAAAGIVCLVAGGCSDSTGPFDANEPRFVFASNRDGNFEIYTMETDGGDPERLTNDAAADNQPTWAPDGEHIVFTSERSGNRDIWIMDEDGANPLNLTANGAIDDHPTVSPDGTRIAFSSTRDGNAEIYLMNVDGSGLQRLTTNAAADNWPAWSPDGTRIAFQSTRGDGLADDIFVMNASDGGNIVRLTTDAGPDQSPTWSGNGTRIAFATSRTGNSEIFTMDPDGTCLIVPGGVCYDKINISNNAFSETQPSYAPAGFIEFLGWTSNRDGNPEIYRLDADGGQVRLTNNNFIDENAAIR